MENSIVILNPNYHLRNDGDKIILSAKPPLNTYGLIGWQSSLHPLHAQILSFFTWDRSFSQNLELLSSFLKKDIKEVERLLLPYINNEEPFYVEWKGYKIKFPSRVLIEKSQANDKYTYPNLLKENFVCKEELNLDSGRCNSIPLSITFMLTNKCMTRCTYCYADTRTVVKNKLSTGRIRELIKEAAANQVVNIGLIGGEVFLHKDWHIIYKALIDDGFPSNMISTKCPVDEDIIAKLKFSNYKHPLQISLDSIDPDKLMKILQVDSIYIIRIMNGLKQLDKENIPYQIATVLTEQNSSIENIREMYEFLKHCVCLKRWEIRMAMHSIYIEKDKFTSIKTNKTNIENIFKYIEENIKGKAQFKISLGYSDLKKEYYYTKEGSSNFQGAGCSALNNHMFVLPDGKVTICEQLYWNPHFIIGDLNYMSLQEVWNSPRALYFVNLSQQDIQENSNCNACTIFDKCIKGRNRCWADVIKAYGKDNWDYPDPRCKYANPMKIDLRYS
ncbi:MAG: radical SAM protein [Tannerellaceae bacterium]|nr:radical SAM protein [Tannerellaceae bacterium]